MKTAKPNAALGMDSGTSKIVSKILLNFPHLSRVKIKANGIPITKSKTITIKPTSIELTKEVQRYAHLLSDANN